MTLIADFEAAMARLLPEAPRRLGVAVSGGSDSMALLHLMSDWCAPRHVALSVATVDHGLRIASRAEARAVRLVAEGLGLPHASLVWEGHDGRGNLPDAARGARYGLLRDWAQTLGLDAVAVGHTRDDQAETVLMNLARGSGVDGLSAMAARHDRHGFEMIRPVLGVERADLRAWLAGRGVQWIDDPTNVDPNYKRTLARQALEILLPLGITIDGLTATADRMARARRALEAEVARVAAGCVTQQGADLVIAATDVADVQSEIQGRLIAAALKWVSGATYPPRAQAVQDMVQACGAGQAMTLHGCLMYPTVQGMRLTREASAAKPTEITGPQTLWDGRWTLETAGFEGLEVRALGQTGLDLLGGRRPDSPPYRSFAGLPSIWDKEMLVSCPHAQFGRNCPVEIAPTCGSFAASLLPH